MEKITFELVTKGNYQEALSIEVFENQKSFVPSVMESLAYAYIKPWDEELKPYIIKLKDQCVGFFYLSYTPGSTDNYWIGGLQIHHEYQGKKLGQPILISMLDYIKKCHPKCEEVSLTVEKENHHAVKLYKKVGFVSDNVENQYGEVIYRNHIKNKV